MDWGERPAAAEPPRRGAIGRGGRGGRGWRAGLGVRRRGAVMGERVWGGGGGGAWGWGGWRSGSWGVLGRSGAALWRAAGRRAPPHPPLPKGRRHGGVAGAC